LKAFSPHSTQLWNSFESCNRIIKRFGLKNWIVYKHFNVSPMKVYKRPMNEYIGWLWWHKVWWKPKWSNFSMGSWIKKLRHQVQDAMLFQFTQPILTNMFHLSKCINMNMVE
jgi:hypothetical protein